MIMLLEVLISATILYLIQLNPILFHQESFLPAYTLSHFYVHLSNMVLFDFELPFSSMLLQTVHTYFSKIAVLMYYFKGKLLWQDYDTMWTLALMIGQSIIFNLFVRKRLTQFLYSNKLITFLCSLGGKIALARYMIYIYHYFGEAIYPSFNPDLIHWTIFGAICTPLGLVILMINEGHSLSYIVHKLNYGFVNLTIMYFSPILVLAYWKQHRLLQTPLYKQLQSKCSKIDDEQYVHYVVIYGCFILVELVSTLIRQNSQYQQSLLEKKPVVIFQKETKVEQQESQRQNKKEKQKGKDDQGLKENQQETQGQNKEEKTQEKQEKQEKQKGKQKQKQKQN